MSNWTVRTDFHKGISIIPYPIVSEEDAIVEGGIKFEAAKAIVDAHNAAIAAATKPLVDAILGAAPEIIELLEDENLSLNKNEWIEAIQDLMRQAIKLNLNAVTTSKV